ncbi:MAG: DUF1643 domain-containing protein [Vicinamibacteria bacterium]
MKRWAEFDRDRRYRWLLVREWAPERAVCMFIMLNPSTADETTDDPTIRRCISFADRWDYGTLYVVNLFGFRAAKPEALVEAADPVGPMNDEWIRNSAPEATLIVCAWGTLGALYRRDQAVTEVLAAHPLKCLGRTRDGHPRHPLYVKSETTLEDWRRP